MADFIPQSFENLKVWLEELKMGIAHDGPRCGRTAAQVTQDIGLVDSILTPVTAALTKQTAAVEASGMAETAIATTMPALRALLNVYRSLPGWSGDRAKGWKVTTQHKSYDMTTHGPTITAQAAPGIVLIRGAKPGFTSVTIQMRRGASSSWLDIGVKLSRFPLMDTTAPQIPGKPEKREYRAMGYVGDQQMGQPSNLVTAIFGV